MERQATFPPPVSRLITTGLRSRAQAAEQPGASMVCCSAYTTCILFQAALYETLRMCLSRDAFPFSEHFLPSIGFSQQWCRAQL